MKIRIGWIINKYIRSLLSYALLLLALVLSSTSMLSAKVSAKPDSTTSTPGLTLNSLRIGDDYRIFNLPEGTKANACERACQKQTKCRAWTFIRERVKRKKGITFNMDNGLSFSLGGNPTERILPAQCRLKYDVGSSIPNDCCVSGVVRNMDKNAQGEEDRCARLAKRAVSQNDRNLAKDCGLRGSLWDGDYSQHYDQCIKSGAEGFQSLVKTRNDELSACAGASQLRRTRRHRACELYADRLVSMNEVNITRECGFSGSLWHSNFDTHYKSCQRNGDETADNKEMLQALDAIKLCLARGGGAFTKRCNDFASDAISQQQQNIKNKCGFSGDRWHDDYKTHYQRCRKLTDWRRDREQKSRIKVLSQCVRDKKRKSAICQTYAQQAVRDQDKNIRLGCKLEGQNRWHKTVERHVQMCMALSDRQRRIETNIKKEALGKCEREKESGHDKDAFCKDYASVAIAQNRENVKSRCRYTGALWSDRYRDHYAWCLRYSESESKAARRSRRERLVKCQLGGHF